MSVVFTRQQLQPFIDEKYISVQKHPEADLGRTISTTHYSI